LGFEEARVPASPDQLIRTKRDEPLANLVVVTRKARGFIALT